MDSNLKPRPKRTSLQPKQSLTLTDFKNGFSCIPLFHILKIAENYKLRSGNLFFRAFSDLVSEKVWYDNNDTQLYKVLNEWHHCFPRDYIISK